MDHIAILAKYPIGRSLEETVQAGIATPELRVAAKKALCKSGLYVRTQFQKTEQRSS